LAKTHLLSVALYRIGASSTEDQQDADHSSWAGIARESQARIDWRQAQADMIVSFVTIMLERAGEGQAL